MTAEKHDSKTQDARLEELPLFSWAEGNTMLSKAGKKLKRWGSVQEACEILAGCDPKTIHALIHTGQVDGFKLNPLAPNSHFRVDLWGVWKHKTKQLAEA